MSVQNVAFLKYDEMTPFATLKWPVACGEWQMGWSKLRYTMVSSTLSPFATCGDRHLFRNEFLFMIRLYFLHFVTKEATRIT
jgi:hypothetical protein